MGTKAENNGEPHPVDVVVGGRMRELRIRAGITQAKLGQALGVSFQQIQKYERGTNRMGASRLVQVAQTLNCSVESLFDGVGIAGAGTSASPLDPAAAKVARDWAAIGDPGVRTAMREVLASLARTAQPTG